MRAGFTISPRPPPRACGARRRGRATGVVTALAGAAVALGALAADDAAPNYGFEALDAAGRPVGWSVDGGGRAADDGAAASVAVVDDVALRGARSLRISAGGRDGAGATLRIPPPKVEGNRLRIAVHVKTEDVRGGAGPWLRIEGAGGLLYVDRSAGGASGTTDWTRYEVESPVFEAATELELGLRVSGGGTAWFDAVSIEGADTAGLPPPSPAAARYLERALDLIETHSMMRAAIDWPSFREKVHAQARGAAVAADTYLALRYALGSLGDHHSYLTAPDRAAALDRAPVSNARTGRPPVPPDGRDLGGGVAYVAVPGFAGGTHAQQVELAERLQELIRSLDASAHCGWIVDLRRNSGGNVWPMLAGIGPLIGEGEAAAAVYPDGRRVPLWYRDGKAGLGDYVQLRVRGEGYRLRSARPRVAVLLGSRTGSSGEILAIALRAGEHRRTFGAPTRGLSTGNRTFALSDGAALVLAVAATSDRTGRVYRGPIRPDEPVAAGAQGGPLLEQDDVRTAARWLESDCASPHRPGEAVADAGDE